MWVESVVGVVLNGAERWLVVLIIVEWCWAMLSAVEWWAMVPSVVEWWSVLLTGDECCWVMLTAVDWWWVPMSVVEWCQWYWVVRSTVKWCYVMFRVTEWCWVELCDAKCCCLVLSGAEWRWVVLSGNILLSLQIMLLTKHTTKWWAVTPRTYASSLQLVGMHGMHNLLTHTCLIQVQIQIFET